MPAHLMPSRAGRTPRPRRRRCTLAAAASALLLVGLTGPPAAPAGTAAAPDAWGPVHRFERNVWGSSLTQDTRGVTTVVWGSQRGWPEPVKAARRTPAGRWLAPVRLGIGYSPVVTSDGAGNLLAAWLRDVPDRTTGVWAAYKRVGRAWSRPVHLSTDLDAPGYPDGGDIYGARDLDVALRADGSAVVAWEWGSWDRNVTFRVQAAHRPPGDAWRPARTLTRGRAASEVRTALGPRGRAWVAYVQAARHGAARVTLRSRGARGAWSPPVRPARGSLGDVATTRRGGVWVVVREAGVVKSVSRPPGRRWQAPVTVTPSGIRVRSWSVALTSRGRALVTYLVGARRVDEVHRGPAGRWSGPRTLAVSPGDLSATFAALDARGDLLAGWHDSYGIWTRFRPAGEPWHATTTPHPDRGQVDVLETLHAGVSPAGRPALLWEQEARPLRIRFLRVGTSEQGR